MPTYEYVCTACNHRFELVQKFTDDPISECPECTGAVRKVYFAAGVVFKGSGWYINDSRPAAPSESGSGTAAAPAASTTPASPATPTESSPASASSDAKPATSTPAATPAAPAAAS